MMDNNFTCSKELLHCATDRKIPFVYPSTAAVYGASTDFAELPANERPLSIYDYSKLVFDNYGPRPHQPVFGGLLPDSPTQPVQAVINSGAGEARSFKAVAQSLMLNPKEIRDFSIRRIQKLAIRVVYLYALCELIGEGNSRGIRFMDGMVLLVN